MHELEGYQLFYVINKHQRGFPKIVGGIVVDQAEMLNKDQNIFNNNVSVDACFFGSLGEATKFMEWVEKKGIANLEVRSIEIPYKD